MMDGEGVVVDVKKVVEENENLEIEFRDMWREMMKVGEEGKVIGEEERMYLGWVFYCEKGLVGNMKRIVEQTEYENE
ncbi:hypothetical protein, partial [Cytobacillus oceanisediminis]|uniref:hypothetical protein n=1 Tax=Cytobacillus oceanisediminis TaxID=665099 RepID=UPI0011A44BFF